MKPPISDTLLRQARDWEHLHRWERSELGRALRLRGLSYSEIRLLIPVPKGTLSNWCRDIRLSDAQVEHLKNRTQGAAGLPRDTQWRRRLEVARLQLLARREVPRLLQEPLWIVGVSLYWAEGSKTPRCLEMTNADPSLLRLFIRWVDRYLTPSPEFVLVLHLHEGNDEMAARRYWTEAVGLQGPDFHKTFIKPRGTGHRKNTLPHGVCRVRLRRSADAFVITMAWIDWLSQNASSPTLIFPVGR